MLVKGRASKEDHEHSCQATALPSKTKQNQRVWKSRRSTTII